MRPSTSRYLFATALLAAPALAARADGPPAAAVVDGAELFRPATVARADALVRDIRRRYHFDVRIETLAALPEADRRKIEGTSQRRTKARYLAEFSRERAKEADVDGLYVLVSTDPRARAIEVTAYPSSAGALLSPFKQKELHGLLEKRLRGAQAGAGRQDAAQAAVGFGWVAPWGPDAALLEALAQVKNDLRTQAGDPNAVPTLPVAVVLAVGAGLWLVLTLVRRRMAERDPGGGLFGPIDPGRTAAFLASRFGTPAAFWAYDRLFFRTPGVRPGPPPASGEAPVAPPEDGVTPQDLLHPEPDHADAAAHDGAG
jgi:hypothetical protein